MTDRARPVLVPTLEELAADPTRAQTLSSQLKRQLLARCMVAHAALVAALVTEPEADASDSHDADRAVGRDEAAAILGMKPNTLYRKWRALGLGYRDADGHVKFSNETLQHYIHRKAGNPY